MAQRVRDLVRPLSVRRMDPVSARGDEAPQSARQAGDCDWCELAAIVRALDCSRVLLWGHAASTVRDTALTDSLKRAIT